MHYRKHLYVFILFILSTAAEAQELIKATLYDSLSNTPVPFANIIIKGTLEGVTSNENGYFEIKTKKPEPMLVVSSLGYFTKEIKAADVTSGKIMLRPKSTQLQEVVISGDRVKVFQEKNSYYYIDFDFYDDHILALTALGNKKYVQILDAAGKNITQLQVHSKSESIFKDCIGSLHVLTPDSSYQVYYDYVKLRLLAAYPIDKFNSTLAPCIAMHKETFYFKRYEYRGLKCSFLCVRSDEPGKFYPFRMVADSAKIQDFNSEYDLHYFLEVRRASRGEMYGEPISTLKKNMDKHREELQLDWMDGKWLQPVEAEIHRSPHMLYLFNFTDSVIETYYDYDSLVTTSSFTAHRDKNIQHRVIMDEVTGTAYLPSEKNGITSLAKVDPLSGKAGNTMEIKGYSYPLKMKVRNGIAYFLYRDKGTEEPAKINRFVLQ